MMGDIHWVVEGEEIQVGDLVYIRKDLVIRTPQFCQARLYDSTLMINFAECQGKPHHEGMHFADTEWAGNKVYVQWNNAPSWSIGAKEKIKNDTVHRRWK